MRQVRLVRAGLSQVLPLLYAAGIGSTASGQSYTMTVLSTLRTDGGGVSLGLGVNASGVVVGRAETDSGELHVARWNSSGVIADLGTLVSPYPSVAFDINASGELCGAGSTQSSGFASALRQSGAGSLVNLPEGSGGGDSYGYGIADDGTIVGWTNFAQGCGSYVCAGNPGHAVRWVGTSISLLPDLGGYYSVASDISHDGSVICGFGANPGGQTRAYRLVGVAGTAVALAPLAGDSDSYGNGVNNAGDVVGYSIVSGGSAHAVLWPAGSTVATNLGTLAGALHAYPQSINASGVIVGYCDFGGGTSRAVRFSPGAAPQDLNSLIAPVPGWTVSYADEVSDNGKITGDAFDGTNHRAMVLTPPCVGDVNGDHQVNTIDPGQLLSKFGQSVVAGTLGDINGDGVVNTIDLGTLLSHFGQPCP